MRGPLRASLQQGLYLYQFGIYIEVLYLSKLPYLHTAYFWDLQGSPNLRSCRGLGFGDDAAVCLGPGLTLGKL